MVTEPDPVSEKRKESPHEFPARESTDRKAPDRGAERMLAFQAGDAAAFDEIISMYQTCVFQFILRTVGDRGRAEDLTQDLFVRVYRSRARYQPSAKFRTWLFTIASRLSLNELRAQRRRHRLFVSPSAWQAKTAADGPGDDFSGSDFFARLPRRQNESPSERLECEELSQIVEGLLAELPPNQRAALQLQMSEEISYREIAEVLGVSTLAVKSLLVRARETLKRGVEGYFSGERKLSGEKRVSGEKKLRGKKA